MAYEVKDDGTLAFTMPDYYTGEDVLSIKLINTP